MRVLYLTPGHTVHDERFAQAIESGGHQAFVEVVPDQPRASRGEIPIRDEATLRDPQRAFVAAAIERIKPDVIHAGPLTNVARLVAEVGGHPLLAASWGFDVLGPEAAENREVNAWTLARSDALLVDSMGVRLAAEELGMPAERIIQLPWGVDIEAFRPSSDPDARRQLGWDTQTVVVMARSHEPAYGVELGLDGFLLAARQDPSLRLLIIGDGSLRPALEARAAGSGLGERIRFLGAVPNGDLAPWLRSADLYLSASRVDGSSVTLLEAMACAIPAVVSDIAGNREWVEPAASGWLFRDGDSDSLAAALVAAASTPAVVRHAMGRRARSVIKERADWSRNTERLLRAYDLAVARG